MTFWQGKELDVVGKEKNFFAGEAFLSPLDVVGKEMRVGIEIVSPTRCSGERNRPRMLALSDSA